MKNADKPISPAVAENINGTPFFEYSLPHSQRQYAGLTKREYFAGLAMQGLLTTVKPTSTEGILEMPSNIAKWSVKCADELLKELETTQAD